MRIGGSFRIKTFIPGTTASFGRNAFGRFGGDIELVDIFARQKALRYGHVEVRGADQQESRSQHGGEFMSKHDLEAAVVCVRESNLDRFEEVEEAAVSLFVSRLQEPAAEHGRQRERDKTRYHNR